MKLLLSLISAALLASKGIGTEAGYCPMDRSDDYGPEYEPRDAEDDEELKFIVNITCQPDGLRLSWNVSDLDDSNTEDNYVASVNYVCSGSDGEIYSDRADVYTAGDEHGVIDTSSAPLQEIINSGATCSAYGCHHDGADSFPLLLNRNVSCSYDELSGSTSSTSTNSATFMPTDQTEESTAPSSTTATPDSENLTAIISLETTVVQTTSQYTDASKTLSPITSETATKRSALIIITTVTAVLIVAAPLAALLICVLLKKRGTKNYRLKHLEKVLYTEIMDPHYMPIDVGADIHKCESIGSVFEHLNNGPRFFAISVSDLYRQPPTSQAEEAQKGPYLLQPPPLKSKHYMYNVTREDSLESTSSCSDYHSSTTSLSTLPQQVDTPSDLTPREHCDLRREELTITCALNEAGNSTLSSMGNHDQQSTTTSSPCQHGGYMCESVYTANENLVGNDCTTTMESSSENTLSGRDNSVPVKEDSVPVNGDGYVQEPHVSPRTNEIVTKSESPTKDVVEDNSSPPEECNICELNQTKHMSTMDLQEEIDDSEDNASSASSEDSDSHVILTFPPSNTNNGSGNMIGFEPSYLPGAFNSYTEEGLTSMNLKINPHHFHPLEHFVWHQH